MTKKLKKDGVQQLLQCDISVLSAVIKYEFQEFKLIPR